VKTIMVDPVTKEWSQVWDNETYDDLEAYVDELWDTVIEGNDCE
jgi:hypothetical protein